MTVDVDDITRERAERVRREERHGVEILNAGESLRVEQPGRARAVCPTRPDLDSIKWK